MEIKNIEFVEQYLIDTPKDNYWRGVSVYIDNIKMLSFNFEQSTYPVTLEEINDDGFWIRKDRDICAGSGPDKRTKNPGPDHPQNQNRQGNNRYAAQ